jgi:hypothetical protein
MIKKCLKWKLNKKQKVALTNKASFQGLCLKMINTLRPETKTVITLFGLKILLVMESIFITAPPAKGNIGTLQQSEMIAEE